MNDLLGKSWWMLALQGALAIVFGIFALLVPGATLIVLVALFAAWAVIGGAGSVLAAVQHRHSDRSWWLVLLLGIVSIAAGVIAIFNPAITLFVLVLIMGVNALATGVLEIFMAIRLRKTIEREWLLALAGAVSVIFGVLVLAFPVAGVLTMVLLVSFYATMTGVLLLALGLRARKWAPASKDASASIPRRAPT
jgi:uncharacterized membrane protein HdeD (DUF308 family)